MDSCFRRNDKEGVASHPLLLKRSVAPYTHGHAYERIH